jgi:hypothetical protein
MSETKFLRRRKTCHRIDRQAAEQDKIERRRAVLAQEPQMLERRVQPAAEQREAAVLLPAQVAAATAAAA